MAIRVLSLDFDGCLFNRAYIFSREKNVITHNKPFLDQIAQENQEFTEVHLFIGSNRQSRNSDRANYSAPPYYKGSCFPAIEKIYGHLKASHSKTTLDTFLLADIYGDLENGKSYERATDPNYTGEHSDWRFDETKVTILYAQMHKIALANPNEHITFDFYDDRGNGAMGRNIDILEKLRDFYSKNPDLIPANVTLRLHQYAGAAVTPIAEIKGTGFIDQQYRRTVIELAKQAITESCDGLASPIHVADKAKPEKLQKRKAFSPNATLNTSLDSSYVRTRILNDNELASKAKFDAAMRKIQEKIVYLDDQADRLHYLGAHNKKYLSYEAAQKTASKLYHALSVASKAYFKDHDKEAFKNAADAAINMAKNSELKNHRGCLKEILAYASLAVLALLTVATAGLAYAVAGGINYAVNRQFFFSTEVNTDSMNKVMDLEDTVEELISAAPAA